MRTKTQYTLKEIEEVTSQQLRGLKTTTEKDY